MKQWFKEFTHNCLIHPLMMFMPKKFGNKLHDKNATWVFGLSK